jgi:hypothetical protein
MKGFYPIICRFSKTECQVLLETTVQQNFCDVQFQQVTPEVQLLMLQFILLNSNKLNIK